MMKKLILLIFICSIFNLITSDEVQVTQVLKQSFYYDEGCGTSDLAQDQHIVPDYCYQWGSNSRKYLVLTDSDETLVRVEFYEDTDCGALSDNETLALGCTIMGEDTSIHFVLESPTADIYGLGYDSEENGNCDEIYVESYMKNCCYTYDGTSHKITGSGQTYSQTYYSGLSCSSQTSVMEYTLDVCRDSEEDEPNIIFLIGDSDSSNETDGGLVNSINFFLLFSFLILNSLFFLY
ncbi:hypothetical protein M0812_08987 [Anaeramoeba flamelloides]|uniref:Uncharacterized protein n=1 Tax=Anaeramoeba flamelloides TaxID=1746091 RepID=A0AAV7ZT62_9EUKA|nr:hypothetical protein M0812_08987 [Anaeramoeba flamelloides]